MINMKEGSGQKLRDSLCCHQFWVRYLKHQKPLSFRTFMIKWLLKMCANTSKMKPGRRKSIKNSSKITRHSFTNRCNTNKIKVSPRKDKIRIRNIIFLSRIRRNIMIMFKVKETTDKQLQTTCLKTKDWNLHIAKTKKKEPQTNLILMWCKVRPIWSRSKKC